MAVDAFIWFESASGGLTPEGETTDELFSKKKAFEIKDFSFGVENPTTIGSTTGGAGAGKVRFNEFTIKRTTDKSSPLPGDEGPEELITFAFGKLGIMFTPTAPGSKLVSAGWDQVLNKDATDVVGR